MNASQRVVFGPSFGVSHSCLSLGFTIEFESVNILQRLSLHILFHQEHFNFLIDLFCGHSVDQGLHEDLLFPPFQVLDLLLQSLLIDFFFGDWHYDLGIEILLAGKLLGLLGGQTFIVLVLH